MASSIEANAVRWKIRQGGLPEYNVDTTLSTDAFCRIFRKKTALEFLFHTQAFYIQPVFNPVILSAIFLCHTPRSAYLFITSYTIFMNCYACRMHPPGDNPFRQTDEWNLGQYSRPACPPSAYTKHPVVPKAFPLPPESQRGSSPCQAQNQDDTLYFPHWPDPGHKAPAPLYDHALKKEMSG